MAWSRCDRRSVDSGLGVIMTDHLAVPALGVGALQLRPELFGLMKAEEEVFGGVIFVCDRCHFPSNRSVPAIV